MNCNVANDLIPMYAEGLCSEKTAEEIKEHILSCNECSKKLKEYKAEIPAVDIKLITPKKAFGKARLYIIVISVIIGIIILFFGLIGIYNLYGKKINYMKADEVFFGYDATHIIKNTGKNLKDLIISFYCDESRDNFEEYFSDTGFNNFTEIKKALTNSQVDYSSLSLDAYGNDCNCTFTVKGNLVCENGKRLGFCVTYIRLFVGKYYGQKCDVFPTPYYSYGTYEDYDESTCILPEKFKAYSFDFNIVSSDENYEKETETYNEYLESGEEMYEMYLYDSDKIIPDGTYKSEDGDFIRISGNTLTIPFYSVNTITGEKYDDYVEANYEYRTYEAEIIYSDRTEYKTVLDGSEIGLNFSGFSLKLFTIYENNSLYSWSDGEMKEYKFSENS